MNDKHSQNISDERLAELARDYNEPLATPRDAMWEQIAARRAETCDSDHAGGDVPTVTGPSLTRPGWRSRKLLWPMAAAAVLVVGIGIGRLTVPNDQGNDLAVTDSAATRPGDPPQDEVVMVGQQEVNGRNLPSADSPGSTGETSDRPASSQDLYRHTAANFLGQAEMLLAQYRTGETTGTNGDSFTTRAVRLLSQTRMLLDCPAAEDAQLNELLSDLELVLARLVRYAAGQNQDEKEWIDENLQQRFLLPRLRAQIPVGAALTTL